MTDKQALSDITVFNKYARFTKEKNRRENWNEIVSRNAAMHKTKYPWMAKDIDLVYNKFVHTKKVLPSMRSLQFGGRPILMAENRIFNCAYAPAESTKFFSELMFLLLGGTGMGYSVQRRHTDKLPKIKTPESDEEYKYQVQDSIVGWSDAVKVVCKAFFNAGTLPIFDYRDIREKGAELITTGGQAPGPEPLKICITQLTKLLRNAVGRKLEPIEVHDMACIIADAVLAGGIRRAAMISLFDLDDDDMLSSKSGEWWKTHPARARANNSAVLLRGEVTELEFYDLMQRVEDSGCGEPGIYWTNNKDWGTNPCCFTGDTRLLTSEGYKPLVELAGTVFDNININGNITPGKVWSNGIKEIVEVKFVKAPSIRCTPDHVFMTTDGKGVEAKDLKGMRLMPHYVLKYCPEDTEAFKAGFILGDGGLGRLNSDVHRGLEVHIGAKDLDVAYYFGVDTAGVYYQKEAYDIAIKFGLKASSTFDRELPDQVSNDFMMGLYSANGSVIKSGKRIALKTTSIKLRDQVVSWLELHGMTPYCTTNKPTNVKFSNGEYLCKESYDVNLGGVDNLCKFATLVSFVHEYKQDALVQAILDSGKYVCAVKPAGMEEVFDFNEPEEHWGVIEGVVVHNCEIALRPYQMCNLTEINAGAIKTQRDFNEAASAAAFIGTLQAGYTDFHYLNPKWRLACEKEALLGVSMTGIASGTVEKLDMEWASQCVVDTNREVSSKLGINAAARSTCVKPAGTTSLVLGTSSGIHAWHAPYYIRRMRAGKDEALAQYMMKAAPGLVEQDVTKESQVVLSFPQAAPLGACVRTEPMMTLLERVKNVSIKWVANGHTSGTNQHNVSCTISVKDDEWEQLAIWMWENREHYNGISVLPYHGASAYPQLPFEDITKEQYEAMLPLLEGIDIGKVFEEDGDSIDLKAELACSGGQCEISF